MGSRSVRAALWVAAALAALVALRFTVFREKPIPVDVVAVARGRVENTVTNSKSGTVESRRRASLSPETGGRVAALPVREGDRVKVGDPILRLADEDARSQLAFQERSLEAARAGAAEACAAAAQAERDLARNRALALDRIVSAAVLDQFESRKETADAAGVTRRGYPTQDGTRAADITLSGVKVGADAVIGEAGKAYPVIERTVQNGIAYLAAEAVGAMSALHELTVEYLKTRKQFGVPIGSFQVLQHKSVDMFTALEQARSMAYYATMMAGEADARERSRALSAAKVQIGRSARFVGETAIQLHGGIGMTMEYKAGHYFKRLTMIDMAYGDADHHLRLLGRAGGLS